MTDAVRKAASRARSGSFSPFDAHQRTILDDVEKPSPEDYRKATMTVLSHSQGTQDAAWLLDLLGLTDAARAIPRESR